MPISGAVRRELEKMHKCTDGKECPCDDDGTCLGICSVCTELKCMEKI